jgi:hypothetical protein
VAVPAASTEVLVRPAAQGLFRIPGRHSHTVPALSRRSTGWWCPLGVADDPGDADDPAAVPVGTVAPGPGSIPPAAPLVVAVHADTSSAHATTATPTRMVRFCIPHSNDRAQGTAVCRRSRATFGVDESVTEQLR